MASALKHTVRGRIVDPQSKEGIEGVRVEIWDKTEGEIIGVAWTDEDGSYRAELSAPVKAAAPEPAPVRPGGILTHGPLPLPRLAGVARLRPNVLRPFPTVGAAQPRAAVALGTGYEVRLPDGVDAPKAVDVAARVDGFDAVIAAKRRPSAFPAIQVTSFAELMQHEAEIVTRLNRLPNGGQLFLSHPFLAMAEVGVVLTPAARKEIVSREPKLRALSPVPFHALRTSQAKQNVRVNVRGLFRRQP